MVNQPSACYAAPLRYPVTALSLALFMFSSGALAQTDMSLGPVVGTGSMTGSKVTSTAGFALDVSHAWTLNTGGLTLAPELELAETEIGTKQTIANGHGVGTYDNRILAAGGQMAQRIGAGTWWDETPYVSLLAGRAFTKLDVATTTSTQSTDTHFQNITAAYYSTEVGTSIPLANNLKVAVAVVSSLYQVDQSHASGSYAQDTVSQTGGLTLNDGQTLSDSALKNQATIRTNALKVALSVTF